MYRKPTSKTGIGRIWKALFNSLDGLGYAIRHEAAFRQELYTIAVLLVILWFLPLSPVWKGVLLFATLSVLVVELLNSAIETVVDLVSPEFHDLAKRAKDLGSAAVMVSLILAGLLWIIAIISVYMNAS